MAITGYSNSVSGNTMNTMATGNYSDMTGISIREAFGCVISNNTILGDSQTGGVVIAISATITNILEGNIITGNTIKTVGGNTRCILLSNLLATPIVKNNIISNNVCIGNGVNSEAFISIIAGSAGDTAGNVITNNTITMRTPAQGIKVQNLKGAVIANNCITLEADGAAPEVVRGIWLVLTSYSNVTGNAFLVLNDWGANISFRCVEDATNCFRNKTSENAFNAFSTKLTQSIAVLSSAATELTINETGKGAPNLYAAIGSIWRRNDGGANTVLYIKESGTGASGWVGK